MTKKILNLNMLLMFLSSLIIAYISAELLVAAGTTAAYDVGFILGRALMGVLLPFALAYVPVAVIRREKPKISKGILLTWWGLFVLLSVLSLIGSTVPAS